MIYCANEECENCYKDHLGNFRCIATDRVRLVCHSKDIHSSVMQCLAFKNRIGRVTPELYPGRSPDGLYPGQIKP